MCSFALHSRTDRYHRRQTMNEQKVYQEMLRFLLERKFGDPTLIESQEPFDGSESLRVDLNLDSIDEVMMILALEEAFEVTVPDKELEDVTTTGEMADVFLKHINTA